MIQSTNSFTPEIVAELHTLLNQLEDSIDDIFKSVQRKTKNDLMITAQKFLCLKQIKQTFN